jgi:hypothetical protein
VEEEFYVYAYEERCLKKEGEEEKRKRKKKVNEERVAF